MTKLCQLLMLLSVVGVLAAPGLASSDPNSTGEPAAKAAPAGPEESWSKSVAVIGACLGAALAAAAGGYGVAKIGSGCIESIARQPEAARDMFAPMVVAAGMVEVGMLFAIVVCLLSIYR